jgi:cell wall-associated NlpC family hydrolase
VAGLVSGLSVGLTTQPAAAATTGFRVFFQTNDHVLAEYSSGATVYKSTLGMAPGTSPSATMLTDGTYEVAFQANNHYLAFSHFGGGTLVTHYGMDAASSPAITGLANGTWIAFFQTNTHNLAYYTSSGTFKELNLGMYAGTNPAVAAQPNGAWTATFEANTSQLFTYNSNGSSSNTGAGLDPATSPAIIGLHDGSYIITGQASNHYLATIHASATGHTTNTTTLGMYAGTNPAIAVQDNGTDWTVAFEANTGDLYTYNSNGSHANTGAGLQKGTSPAIIPLTDGTYELAGQANTNTLATAHVSTTSHTTNTTTLGMDPNTNPTIGVPTPVTSRPAVNPIVAYAEDIAAGDAEPGWGGGHVPYSWGGGHGSSPGPSLGTCVGYTGPSPCQAGQTKGVDCSGFTRWVLSLAYGFDVLGPGNTNSQIAQLTRVSTGSQAPGDLVFYGSSTTNTHHVGIYIGGGEMIDALQTGTVVRQDSVNVSSDIVGYYRETAHSLPAIS